MYRYTVDNAVTYTSEDFVLYRESPFACWMERLTLENPDHGIPADLDSGQPVESAVRQDDIAETLRDEGRNVVLVDWEMAEPARRNATLEAMRKGADFVVNGQLALGPLSGAANLLMRTSGYSDLGDYLYVPCDTQGKTTLHSAFRLCFLADLLHMLQGQLPPQMLIIRGGSDVVPLETEEHIYHYRAVKQRFMSEMREFRKHRMPDPAESSHFGRWSDCANEVIKQRAMHGGEVDEAEEHAEEALPMLAAADGDRAELPVVQAEGQGGVQLSPASSVSVDTRRAGESQVNASVGGTLAEQASQLGGAISSPSAHSLPGHTPNLAPVMAARPQVLERRRPADEQFDGEVRPEGARLSGVALDNLEFIGRSVRRPAVQREAASDVPAAPPGAGSQAVPEVTDPVSETGSAYTFPEQGASLDPERVASSGQEEPVSRGEELTTLADQPFELPATRVDKQHPLDSSGMPGQSLPTSVIDRDDSAPLMPDAEPQPSNPAPRFSWDALEEDAGERDFLEATAEPEVESEIDSDAKSFSNSLITNEEFGERD